MTITTANWKTVTESGGLGEDTPFLFKAFDDADLHVFATSPAGVVTEYALTTDYTVDGGSTNSGGRIVWESGVVVPDGYDITVERVTPLLQGTALRSQSALTPSVMEDALDKLVMASQELDGALSGLATQAALTAEATARAAADSALGTRLDAIEDSYDAIWTCPFSAAGGTYAENDVLFSAIAPVDVTLPGNFGVWLKNNLISETEDILVLGVRAGATVVGFLYIAVGGVNPVIDAVLNVTGANAVAAGTLIEIYVITPTSEPTPALRGSLIGTYSVLRPA